MKQHNDCTFCKIVAGEIPSYKIYEDEHFYAFLDRVQLCEGHTLLIPKEHFRFIWDVPDEYNYFAAANKIVSHYIKDLGFPYVDSVSFGRMIPHAHLHLLPHNGERSEWTDALEDIGRMQLDETRWFSPEKATIIMNKFKLY